MSTFDAKKKDCIDLETMQKVIALLDYELAARKEADPVDADSKIAKLEELIRRRLARGKMSKRDLEKSCAIIQGTGQTCLYNQAEYGSRGQNKEFRSAP